MYTTVKGHLSYNVILADDRENYWLLNNVNYSCNGYFLLKSVGTYYEIVRVLKESLE